MATFKDRIASAYSDEQNRRRESGESLLTKTDLWKTAKGHQAQRRTGLMEPTTPTWTHA